MPHDSVIKLTAEWINIIDITYGKRQLTPEIQLESNTRLIKFRLSPGKTTEDLPTDLPFKKLKCMLIIDNAPPKCRRCNIPGHIKKNCPEPPPPQQQKKPTKTSQTLHDPAKPPAPPTPKRKQLTPEPPPATKKTHHSSTENLAASTQKEKTEYWTHAIKTTLPDLTDDEYNRLLSSILRQDHYTPKMLQIRTALKNNQHLPKINFI